MFRKICTLIAGLVLTMAFAGTVQAQTFVEASSYAGFELISVNAVAAGMGKTVTLRGDGRARTAGGATFFPVATTGALHIEAAGGTAEDVTPSSVSCASGALPDSCTFVATFSYAHNAGFKISSADLGVDAAKRASASGSIVMVHKRTSVTMSGASTTATNFIPADEFLYAFTAQVTTTITNATGSTTWKVGPTGDDDMYGASLALATGTVADFSTYTTATSALGFMPAAVSPIVTISAGSMTGGVVAFSATYGVVVP